MSNVVDGVVEVDGNGPASVVGGAASTVDSASSEITTVSLNSATIISGTSEVEVCSCSALFLTSSDFFRCVIGFDVGHRVDGVTFVLCVCVDDVGVGIIFFV